MLATLFTVFTMTPAPQPEEYPRTVTLQHQPAPNGTVFLPTKGIKCLFRVNSTTGEMMIIFKSSPIRDPKKGDTLTEEDGEDKGTVWVLTKNASGSGRTCYVEKVPPPKKGKD